MNTALLKKSLVLFVVCTIYKRRVCVWRSYLVFYVIPTIFSTWILNISSICMHKLINRQVKLSAGLKSNMLLWDNSLKTAYVNKIGVVYKVSTNLLPYFLVRQDLTLVTVVTHYIAGNADFHRIRFWLSTYNQKRFYFHICRIGSIHRIIFQFYSFWMPNVERSKIQMDFVSFVIKWLE